MFSFTFLYSDFLQTTNSLMNTHLLSFVYESYWITLTNYLFKIESTLNLNTSVFASSLFIWSFILKNLFIVTIFFGICFFILTTGLRVISNYLSNANMYHSTFAFMSDLEEEVGSLDDAAVYFLIFAAVITWFFFINVFTIYNYASLSWVVTLLNFVLLTAVLIPFFVLKNFGVSFAAYVRGVGRTSNLMAELFFDFIAIIVMVARFIIQNIRLVLLFAAFFELSEFIYTNLHITGSNYFNNINSDLTNGFFWYDHFADFLVNQIMLLYYQSHLILTFFAQLANYFLLSFVLFFLYTTFLVSVHEKYFFKKL